MSTFDAVSHYFSGQGVVMIGTRDAVTGLPKGLRPVGNVPDMKLSLATTVVEHKGSQDGQRATDARLQTEVKVTCSVTMESWNSANLAKALRGDDTVIPGGTVTDDEYDCYVGLVTGLKHVKLSSVVVKQGSTTLQAFIDDDTDWDYKVNAEAGSILLNDGVLGDYDNFVATSPPGTHYTLKVSYTYAAQNLVDAMTQPLTDNWLRFEGLNTVEDNTPVVVDVFRFNNDPLKELALLSDTFGQFVLEGSVLKDDTKTTGSKYFTVKKVT
jgi:hypothetical protein